VIEKSLAHPARTVPELHHRIPRCLLGFIDRAKEGSLDPEGLQAWFEWEEEAFRYDVDPYISRDDLAALIEGSTVLLPREKHRAGHESDFVRWGRRGGRETLRRYGRPWFALLAQRRWERITASELAAVFGSLS
jgi:hypothetical protein